MKCFLAKFTKNFNCALWKHRPVPITMSVIKNDRPIPLVNLLRVSIFVQFANASELFNVPWKWPSLLLNQRAMGFFILDLLNLIFYSCLLCIKATRTHQRHQLKLCFVQNTQDITGRIIMINFSRIFNQIKACACYADNWRRGKYFINIPRVHHLNGLSVDAQFSCIVPVNKSIYLMV